MKRIFYTLSFIALNFGANAQNFIEEFNYGTVDSNLTQVGSTWVAHIGPGSNPVRYVATGGPFYPMYTATTLAGGSVTLAHRALPSESINKAISPTVTSGSVYASFIMKVTASGGTTGDYHMHFIDGAGPFPGGNFRSRLFVKNGSSVGTFNIGISKGSDAPAATFSATDYNLNQDYIVILKYQLVPGVGNDVSSAFVINGFYPPTEPTATVTATNPGDLMMRDITSIASVALRQGDVGTGSFQIDGLRISTSWTNAQLPVKWSSFNVTKNADASLLRWSTASESNNSHFEIQRSVDGKNFEAIGKVKGSGNSNKTSNYSYTDKEVATSKTTYYRLKQVDFDGKTDYSKTVSVINTIAKAGIGATLPNPFNSDLNISFTATAAATANVVIMDMLGKAHHSSTEQLQVGANTITVNTTDMPDGIYFVKVSYNGETFTQKVIKK